MQQHSAPRFTVTPRGIMMDGQPLAKSASGQLPSETRGYIKRAEQLLAKVKPEDWDDRTPHAMNNVPLLAQAQMMAALASPQPYPPLQKQSWQELTKDGDADDDDGDSDDDSASADDDGGDYSASGNSHYNPDEPRIPAGQPGGGQWTTGGNGTTSDSGSISADDIRSTLREDFNNPSSLPQGTQVADSGQTMTDAPAGNGNPQGDINQIKTGIQTENHGFITPTSTNPDSDQNYVNQVNIFIGGAGDQSQNHIVLTSNALYNATGSNYYFTHDSESLINDFIDSLPDDTTVNLIGHSWGGDTAATVALDNPDSIDTLITIDPVSRLKPNYANVAASVDTWVNVNPNSTSQPNATGGDWAARIGGAWGNGPDNYATVPIETQLHHENFNQMMTTAAPNGKTPLQILNASH